jgi:hypothetical protein
MKSRQSGNPKARSNVTVYVIVSERGQPRRQIRRTLPVRLLPVPKNHRGPDEQEHP